MGFVALVAATSLLFDPAAQCTIPAGARDRSTALGLVHAHGTDTLAFFKLRRDATLFIAHGSGRISRVSRNERRAAHLRGSGRRA